MTEKNNQPCRLHLGCGQTYLQGYINIDYPSSEHTVQVNRVADRFEDITKLRFGRYSVDEVRLHHVFEHFRRPQIAAMVAGWNSWLRAGGKLHIEVPDLGRIARVFLNPFSGNKARAVAERHLFGSHEASWAAHYEGYDERMLRKLLNSFGFRVDKLQRKNWLGTHNIHIFASKSLDLATLENANKCAEDYLRDFLVDDSPGEITMLSVWLRSFDEQLKVGWGSE